MKTTQKQGAPVAIRDRLDDLKIRVGKTSTMTVMANPMQIRDTALETLNLLGEMLAMIEALSPYHDEEGAPLG